METDKVELSAFLKAAMKGLQVFSQSEARCNLLPSKRGKVHYEVNVLPSCCVWGKGIHKLRTSSFYTHEGLGTPKAGQHNIVDREKTTPYNVKNNNNKIITIK